MIPSSNNILEMVFSKNLSRKVFHPFNPMTVGVKHSQMQHMQRTEKIAVWEKQFIPYSSKFSWHNIFVIFVINPLFTNFFVHEHYVT